MKINEEGTAFIQRKGYWMAASCPHGFFGCGPCCANFYEDTNLHNEPVVTLNCCPQITEFEVEIDERPTFLKP